MLCVLCWVMVMLKNTSCAAKSRPTTHREARDEAADFVFAN
jgi:hypothetical protein